MKIIGMATTPTAAAKRNNLNLYTAKIHKSLILTIIASSKNPSETDPDPMDWNELDSFSNKPPRTERKPRKKPYIKPELVKKFEAVTGNTYRDDTANGLTRLIIDCIKHDGGQAERINTTGIPIDSRRQVTDITGRTRSIGSLTWRPSGSTVGSADISATIKGRSVKIEVKIGKDRQSAAQRQYLAAVEQAGGLYYIARNFTDFWKWYQQTFTKGGTR